MTQLAKSIAYSTGKPVDKNTILVVFQKSSRNTTLVKVLNTQIQIHHQILLAIEDDDKQIKQ
ncbi:hypothetical protein ZONE111904_04005 [Zobellia nedashkovskayae]